MKKIQSIKFVRKPIYVDAVRVTVENMPQVAEWCESAISTTTLRGRATSIPYIKVDVHRPASPRQTQAFVGDWVLKSNTGFKVYQDAPFHDSFERAIGMSWMAKSDVEKEEEGKEQEEEVVEPNTDLTTVLREIGENLLKLKTPSSDSS